MQEFLMSERSERLEQAGDFDAADFEAALEQLKAREESLLEEDADAVLDADALSCDSVFGANVFRVAVHKICERLGQPQLAERPRAVNCHPFCLRACKSSCKTKCTALCRGGLEHMACCSGFGTPGSKCVDGLCDQYVAVHELLYTCMAVEEMPVVSVVPMAAQVS